jgi:hypothetical protein
MEWWLYKSEICTLHRNPHQCLTLAFFFLKKWSTTWSGTSARLRSRTALSSCAVTSPAPTAWSWTSSCTPPSSAKPWDSASQHHSSLCLMYAINPLKVVMKFDLVPEYFGVGIVRKLNIMEEAPASFTVVQFGVNSPLSSKLA